MRSRPDGGSDMILIDSNIFMYAGGSEHPHKLPSVAYLERVAVNEVDAVIDAEVLQEILHRYRAIGRWSDGRGVYDHVRRIIPVVLPIDLDTMDAARAIMDRYERLPARDALHAAVAQVHGIREICSYDRDFDQIEAIDRIEP